MTRLATRPVTAETTMVFNRNALAQQMLEHRPMFLMKITRCTKSGAPQKKHEDAAPFLARALALATKNALRNNNQDAMEGQADAEAIKDEHYKVINRGDSMGFAVISPAMIAEGMAAASPALSFSSSDGITYDVRYEAYTGQAVMKAKDTEVLMFGDGEIPPTACQQVENSDEAVTDCFKNALTKAGLKWRKVEFRQNIAKKNTNKLMVEWTRPKFEDRFNFWKCYTVPLPSTDEGTIRFSGTFCTEFNLHMFCGHPNDVHGLCTNCGSSSNKKTKKTAKRGFDEAFQAHNNNA